MKLADQVFRRKDWYVTSPFGMRMHPVDRVRKMHKGTDYGTKGQKWPQYALEDGTVVSAGKDSTGAVYAWLRYPRIGLEVQHYHLDKLFVKAGQTVNKDTLIGNTGKTGKATGVHLHMSLRKIGSAERLDPHKYEYVPESEKAPVELSLADLRIKPGDLVRIKPDAAHYWPGGPKIPTAAWLRNQQHNVEKITLDGKNPVIKGGEPCVLLLAINSWCALKNLTKE